MLNCFFKKDVDVKEEGEEKKKMDDSINFLRNFIKNGLEEYLQKENKPVFKEIKLNKEKNFFKPSQVLLNMLIELSICIELIEKEMRLKKKKL